VLWSITTRKRVRSAKHVIKEKKKKLRRRAYITSAGQYLASLIGANPEGECDGEEEGEGTMCRPLGEIIRTGLPSGFTTNTLLHYCERAFSNERILLFLPLWSCLRAWCGILLKKKIYIEMEMYY